MVEAERERSFWMTSSICIWCDRLIFGVNIQTKIESNLFLFFGVDKNTQPIVLESQAIVLQSQPIVLESDGVS